MCIYKHVELDTYTHTDILRVCVSACYCIRKCTIRNMVSLSMCVGVLMYVGCNVPWELELDASCAVDVGG